MEAALVSQCSPRRSKQCRKLEVPTLKWPITSANFKDSSQFLGNEILDIAEAIVLALVASLLPAVDIRQRSGLDTGRTCTGQSGKLRVQAERAATAANQERWYNASTVVEWLCFPIYRILPLPRSVGIYHGGATRGFPAVVSKKMAARSCWHTSPGPSPIPVVLIKMLDQGSRSVHYQDLDTVGFDSGVN